MNITVTGDCRETMRAWAADGVRAQMCVTSPPYFGLRDYGHPGQLGLEQTPEAYIAAMVEVFRCVRDVLADDGTLWLNIGDSYAANGRSGLNTGWADRAKEYSGGGHRAEPSRHRGEKRVPDMRGGDKLRPDVWTVPTSTYKGAHFATFPPALIEPCVLSGSRPGDIVLDPFMGSGTTAAVALQHGRQYLGCELNPAYQPLQDARIATSVGPLFA